MFGISTHLYVGDRLDREHLVEIAAHGFDAIEVFAVRNHFDYRDRRAAIALAEWLDDTRLSLHSMHAPIAGSFVNGGWQSGLSLASADEGRRQAAVDETLAALDVAAAVSYETLVVHCGVPAPYAGAQDNHRGALIRSLEELSPIARQNAVRLAVEVIPNELSTPAALVELIESDIDATGLGICMDVGHARVMGDVLDAIEGCSGHIITTHLHDNRGRSDDHLMPGKGVIDWDATLLAFQKVGYDGLWIFELAVAADRKAILEQAAKVRERFEGLLNISDEIIGLDES
jgi:sugar phosphate isomerase/epimerase